MQITTSSPKIAVLMATYNGIDWLQDQIHSILSQKSVAITLFISDDGSSDGTREYLEKLSLLDQRIILLSRSIPTGSAGQNFYRLILDVDINYFDFLAFSDQDDIWNLDKCSYQINLIKISGADAVSSNVIAFWNNGAERLINKSQDQKKYDFIFESAGPGSSFLLKPWVVKCVRDLLINEESKANLVELHDWLIYAIARSLKVNWIIDSEPLLKYRQHQSNVMGANIGVFAKYKRFMSVKKGWYRAEIIKISQVSTLISSDPKIKLINYLVSHDNFLNNLRLIQFIPEARRSFFDRLGLFIMLITCSF